MSNPSSPFFGPSPPHQVHPIGANVNVGSGGPPQLVIANNPRCKELEINLKII
jgi:hypothetical protein